MTHSHVAWLIYMWHDAFIPGMTHPYVTWPIYTWHDSSICDMTHSHVAWLIYMWHDAFVPGMTHPYVTWLCDISHSHVAVRSWACSTMKLWVSFAEYSLSYRALLQKRPITYSSVTHLWHSSFICSDAQLGVLHQCFAVWCSVLQCAAVWCSVSQCVAVCYIVVQRVAVCLQCVAVCSSVVQCAGRAPPVARFSFICDMTIHTYDKTHSYVASYMRHDSFMSATQIDMTHSYIWLDSFIWTRLVHRRATRDMTHS